MTIVIAGGSGYIGTTLSQALLSKGHTIIVVDTIAPSFTHEALFFIQCDLTHQALPYNILERTDTLINLVGVPIGRKWTPQYKKLIYDSRIKSTRALVAALASAQTRPTTFISASSVGYYSDTGGGLVDERAPKGTGFLAEVVSEWEEEAQKAESLGVRTVIIRTAPILGYSGVLYSIMKTKSFGFILRMMKRDYWMSWIHELDLVRIYLYAIETKTLLGPVNASAPETILHRDFVKLLGHTINKYVLGTIPPFFFKKMFGDMAVEITKSQRILPQRLIDKGFEFMFPDARSALADLARRKKKFL